jgi:hypothetical protein
VAYDRNAKYTLEAIINTGDIELERKFNLMCTIPASTKLVNIT